MNKATKKEKENLIGISYRYSRQEQEDKEDIHLILNQYTEEKELHNLSYYIRTLAEHPVTLPNVPSFLIEVGLHFKIDTNPIWHNMTKDFKRLKDAFPKEYKIICGDLNETIR